jgi:predicted small lipoprotein YifL
MKKGLFLTAIIFSIAVVMAFYACGPKGPETIPQGGRGQ